MDAPPFLQIAPMMDWTDRHCRFFHRQMSRRAVLFTEMVTSAAIVHGPAARLLAFSPAEEPLVLQLGGSDPTELAAAVTRARALGYTRFNLNCGCPSDRVQSGTFGAVLMKDPARVAACVAAMSAAAGTPVSVKCRIGVDDQNPEEVLPAFLERLQAEGLREVIIHARKAWLQGLSPKENREVPPLDYPLVFAMTRAFPGLQITLNGGVENLAAAKALLGQGGLAGVMIGRAAYHDPAHVLIGADTLWGEAFAPSAEAVVEAMRPYIAAHLAEGGRLHSITRHMLGLFHGQPGARHWRRVLSEGASQPGAGLALLDAALPRAAAA